MFNLALSCVIKPLNLSELLICQTALLIHPSQFCCKKEQKHVVVPLDTWTRKRNGKKIVKKENRMKESESPITPCEYENVEEGHLRTFWKDPSLSWLWLILNFKIYSHDWPGFCSHMAFGTFPYVQEPPWALVCCGPPVGLF